MPHDPCHNISHCLSEVSNRLGDRQALLVPAKGGYRSWTFAELDQHASAYAHGLAKLDLKKNDRAVLMVRPSLEFICLTFALFRLGVPVVLIDPGMGYRNLLRCIASVRPTVFIGIPRAHLFRKLFPAAFASIERAICVGAGFGFLGKSLADIADFRAGHYQTPPTSPDDLAAIIFTTGSTGPPKGVQYRHGVFRAQLDIIRDYYGITPEDTDQPAFPLFALFSTALGARAVLPDMNPAQPARVDPRRFTRSLLDCKVTYSFGSPAIWNVVSRYCIEHGIIVPSLRQVLMAGAPVSGELIDRVRRILPSGARIHTPYGATEALPVTSITGAEILGETWDQTKLGRGTCVGRPLPGIELEVIAPSDSPIASWALARRLPTGEIGEIVVRGRVVTHSYDHNERENSLAKIPAGDSFWHRMGDLGYLDHQGRLWFCGRKAHRVIAEAGAMFTIPCEAIFNNHPRVYRSALVGVGTGRSPYQTPVLIVEPLPGYEKKTLLADLRKLALSSPLTENIEHFLIHKKFPVDIRHNAKIFREKLAVWAAERINV